MHTTCAQIRVFRFLQTASLLFGSLVHAQTADVKGSQDHPLITRYQGSSIRGYSQIKFEEFVLPLGPVASNRFTKSQMITGKLTRILYVAPAGRSTLEVFTNYQQAMNQAGFQTLFECRKEQCGAFSNVLYPFGRALNEIAYSIPEDQRYFAASLSHPGGITYVSLYVAREGNASLPQRFARPVILEEVIETSAMEEGLVTVNSVAMARALTTSGHIALYGILFDFNSAVIKAESSRTLDEVAKLLKEQPSLQIYVVGHTDDVGGFQSNLQLAKRRAEAVTAELTAKHGIEAGRLQAEGVGLLAPVAPNDSEEGRAKNRRVELVRR